MIHYCSFHIFSTKHAQEPKARGHQKHMLPANEDGLETQPEGYGPQDTRPVHAQGPTHLCRQQSPLARLHSTCTHSPAHGFQTCPPPPLPSASPPAPTSHLVVDVTICKHSVEVLDTFLSIPVIVVFQALLYCSHIHRCFNDLIVILESRESEKGNVTSAARQHSRVGRGSHPTSRHRHADLSSSTASVSHLMGGLQDKVVHRRVAKS